MLHTLYIYPPLSIVKEVKSGIDSKDDSILTRLLSLSPLVFFLQVPHASRTIKGG